MVALPLITLILALPGIGAALTLVGPWSQKQARTVATLFSGLTLAFAFVLLLNFVVPGFDLGLPSDPSGAYGAFEEYTWFQIFGFEVQYRVGVDGLSIPLVFLAALLLLIAVIYPAESDLKPKAYYAMLQIISLALIGVFVTLDFLQFFVFWELVLIPMYFLIGIWGGPNRHHAAIKFLIYTHVGGVVMLLGIFALAVQTGTLNMIVIGQMAPLIPLATQIPIFLAFLFGFGVKLPMVPFHTWLPDAHVEAPTAGSIILAGVLLKMGGYGLFRVAYSMLPQAAVNLWWLVAGLGVASMIYASMICLVQVDLKRLIAYSSIGHMGFVLLGASTFTAIGISGAIFQLFNHGLITAVLFMLAGSVKHATGSREIPHLRGLGAKMPIFSFLIIISFLASLGLPGFNSFISEFMVFAGTYQGLPGETKKLVFIPLLAVALTAAYYLWTMHRVLLGRFSPSLGKVRDLRASEYVPMAVVVFFIFLTAFVPAIWLGLISSFSGGIEQSLVAALGGG
ncbi:MAG: NADH-quinone oxidoreductase subunit M [Thermoplasmata archaeon]